MPVVLLLINCGGGDTESGAAAQAGATPFTGNWFLEATLTVNIGGNATVLADTTEVLVGASGSTVLIETDSECGLDIVVNGNVMVYETTCIFTATNDDTSAPCTLTIRTDAPISGAPGSAALSGAFGPDTQPCRDVAASYTGTLVGSQEGPDDGTDDGNNG